MTQRTGFSWGQTGPLGFHSCLIDQAAKVSGSESPWAVVFAMGCAASVTTFSKVVSWQSDWAGSFGNVERSYRKVHAFELQNSPDHYFSAAGQPFHLLLHPFLTLRSHITTSAAQVPAPEPNEPKVDVDSAMDELKLEHCSSLCPCVAANAALPPSVSKLGVEGAPLEHEER